MMLATSGPRQMQAQSKFDAMYASRTVPLLLPDAAVVVDVGAVLVMDRCALRSILCLLLLLMVAETLRHVLLEQQGR